MGTVGGMTGGDRLWLVLIMLGACLIVTATALAAAAWQRRADARHRMTVGQWLRVQDDIRREADTHRVL